MRERLLGILAAVFFIVVFIFFVSQLERLMALELNQLRDWRRVFNSEMPWQVRVLIFGIAVVCGLVLRSLIRVVIDWCKSLDPSCRAISQIWKNLDDGSEIAALLDGSDGGKLKEEYWKLRRHYTDRLARLIRVVGLVVVGLVLVVVGAEYYGNLSSRTLDWFLGLSLKDLVVGAIAGGDDGVMDHDGRVVRHEGGHDGGGVGKKAEGCPIKLSNILPPKG